MSLNPIIASENIVKKYLRYITTTFYIDDPDYMKQFIQQVNNASVFSKGPYLELSDSFITTKSIHNLIDDGLLSEEFKILYSDKSDVSLLNRPLYKHQELAIKKIITEDKNIVVTTGTGSGKTESFLIPIINYLMKGKESGTLNDGVRALLVYPMNALANDQIKRLRKTLKNYPFITFGSYTGETIHTSKDAENKYIELYNEKPLINERLSRDAIKSNPPHILITNYAMLEYLMLRPEDNVFFNGKYSQYWKYIVLDEAHTYNGTNGIEISMLMRRVVNQLFTTDSIRFILTSATLGDKNSDNEILEFAKRLCCEKEFFVDSIIRPERYIFSDNGEKLLSLNKSIYKEIEGYLDNNDFKSLERIITNVGIILNENNNNTNELLYDLIIKDRLYYKLRSALKDGPKALDELSRHIGIDKTDLVSFINCAVKGEKYNISLLNARYHLFVRALEGAYITVGKYKTLSVLPRDYSIINNEQFKSFKIYVCQFCGKIYIEGKIEENKLKQYKISEVFSSINYYMLCEENQNVLNDFDDEEDVEEDVCIYDLCGKCGSIIKENIINKSDCCGKEYLVKVKEVKVSNKELHKCTACGLISTQGSVLRGFYLGQDAASSVLCSSLYEEIPDVSKHTKITEINDDDFFGSNEEEKTKNLKEEFFKKEVKQLISFSDSRQEAAFFASYLEFTYNNILRKRIVVEAIRSIKKFDDTGININILVSEIARIFEEYAIFNSEGNEVEAWKTILYEISSSDRNSLENLGILSFEFEVFKSEKMGLYTGDDVVTVQRVLANSFKRDCAFDYPLLDKMKKIDKEYFLFEGHEKYMTLSEAEAKDKYAKKWIPREGSSNVRYDYILKTQRGKNYSEIKDFLSTVWDRVFREKLKCLKLKQNSDYLIDINQFKVKSVFTHDLRWFKCKKCGRITVNNIKNVCPSYRCNGELELCEVEKEFKDNHYKHLYTNMKIAPLKVKEHTAQLSSDQAKKYQDAFVKKDINILSCSTTFEMGVDIGDLETVFMKNMPPAPSNFVQRAGRAGRNKSSTAFSLTFCRLSSHDLSFFTSPDKMISGKITPPIFKVENEIIVRRHFHALILGLFWRKKSTYFGKTEHLYNSLCKDEFHKFLKEDIPNYKGYITNVIPYSLHAKIDDWIKDIYSDSGFFIKLHNEYTAEINELEKLYNDELKYLQEKTKNNDIKKISLTIEKTKSESIISHLARKNFIPKYGFPIDTVELITSSSGKSNYEQKGPLRLQRDLLMAISEYAPGSEVIADGNIFRSEYIKKPASKNKVWDVYDYGVCKNKECNNFVIEKNLGESINNFPKPCSVCGEQIMKSNTFIIPEYGFIGTNTGNATTKKLEKTYKGQIYYVGNEENYIKIGEKKISLGPNNILIKVLSNAELCVINTSDFYVCHICGFSSLADKKTMVPLKKQEHKNHYGYKCIGDTLFRRTIGHKFRTDVVYLSFPLKIENNVAMSVLYTLLEGYSEYFYIKRDELNGTIFYTNDEGVITTNFLIFDLVPGGVGYSHKLLSISSNMMRNFFHTALNIVEQCNCGKDSEGMSACYSCLCNFYNQKHHDIIKRKYALDFLKDLLK